MTKENTPFATSNSANVGGQIQRRQKQKFKGKSVRIYILFVIITLLGVLFTSPGKALISNLKKDASEATKAAAKVRPRKIDSIDGS